MAQDNLGTDHPGPLTMLKPDSRTETATCPECGICFERIVYIRPDSTEVPPPEFCPACSALVIEVALEERKIAEAKVIEVTQRSMWRRECGLEGEFTGKTFKNFKRTLQPKAFDLLSAWTTGSVILASPPGTYGVGKTHLLCALVNKLVEGNETVRVHEDGRILKRPCPVRFESDPRLMPRIRQTFRPNAEQSDEDVFQRLSRFGVLVLDDVGKNRPHDLSFTQSVYYRLIDDRYMSGKPIILTTNLSLAQPRELDDYIGGACTDRLREMCGKAGIIVMKGTSYRRTA